MTTSQRFTMRTLLIGLLLHFMTGCGRAPSPMAGWLHHSPPQYFVEGEPAEIEVLMATPSGQQTRSMINRVCIKYEIGAATYAACVTQVESRDGFEVGTIAIDQSLLRAGGIIRYSFTSGADDFMSYRQSYDIRVISPKEADHIFLPSQRVAE